MKATGIVRKQAVKPEKIVDTVTLDHEARWRRRAVLTTDAGAELLLDLDKAVRLDHGDALKREDGGLVAVIAAPEKLLAVTAGDPLRLMRIAWHIGNRHTPAELAADTIYIEDDPVLAEMVRGLGAGVASVTRPFRPEGGAYAGEPGHPHDHAHHDHGHDHQGHDHHAHEPKAHDHAHEHGTDCGCGHDHSHDHAHHEHHRHGRKHG